MATTSHRFFDFGSSTISNARYAMVSAAAASMKGGDSHAIIHGPARHAATSPANSAAVNAANSRRLRAASTRLAKKSTGATPPTARKNPPASSRAATSQADGGRNRSSALV